ncbi:hypothetical protein SHIRM173S_00864 [Streptomyces hirsutus]
MSDFCDSLAAFPTPDKDPSRRGFAAYRSLLAASRVRCVVARKPPVRPWCRDRSGEGFTPSRPGGSGCRGCRGE